MASTRRGTLGTRDLSTAYRPTAFVTLPPGGAASEGYMDHYDNDVRCRGSTPYVVSDQEWCRRQLTGTLDTGGTACTGNNDT